MEKPKVKKKSPQKKESWEVAPPEYKPSQEFMWRCNQANCKVEGFATEEKMRRHLKFHKLSEVDIEALAKDEATMDSTLTKIVRNVYKDSNHETMGKGPFTFVYTDEQLTQEYECLANVTECGMAFGSESELLDHLRQFHPPIVKKELPSPQKLEVGGVGWRCQHVNCGHVVTCVPGSLQLVTHWATCHGDSDVANMRYLELDTCQVMDMAQIYGYAARCGVPACGYIATSPLTFTQVIKIIF